VLHRLLPLAFALLAAVIPPAGAQSTAPYPANGVQLLAQLRPDDFNPPLTWGGKCWGYTAPSGREYAIFGAFRGTAIVEVTDPGRPVPIAVIPGIASGNRSARVFGDHAYVTANAGGGIQVIDLANVDGGVAPLVNTVLGGSFEGTHNIEIDETSGFLYRIGYEAGPAIRVYDLTDPVHPVLVSQWDPPGDHPGGGTVHDVDVITYTAGPYAGMQIAFACTTGPLESLSVIDFTDKSNPALIREAFYPSSGLSHQVWLSEDLQWAFLNDEFDEKFNGLPSTTYVFDVSNVIFPAYVTSFTNGNTAVTHDAFVKGDRLYAANYTSGLRVFDVSDPLAAFEIASFDTWPCNDQTSFDSLYSNFPFFDSGTVIGAGIEGGLFVWRTGEPELAFDFPGGAPTLLAATGDTVDVVIYEAAPGTLVAGSAKLWFDTGTGPSSVDLLDQGNGTFRAVLPALPCGDLVGWFVAAQGQDGATWTLPASAFTRAERFRATVATVETTLFADDFESDLGWTTTAGPGISGAWERTDPDGTPYAPEDDATPGAGTICWVTDDEPSDCEVLPGEVSGGPYRLTSPVIDVSTAVDPIVRYMRWFANDGGAIRDDEFRVEVSSNGLDWSSAEVVGPRGPETHGGWLPHQFRVFDLLPDATTLQVRFGTHDVQANSISEAGVDDFRVLDAACPVATTYCTAKTNSCGSLPTIAAAGTPSATATSGFFVTCANVPTGNSGLIVYSNAGQAVPPTPFQGGLLCSNTPHKRATAVTAFGGTPGTCSGSFSTDMNAFAAGLDAVKPAPFLTVVGARIQCQYLGRDTPTSSLVSDALEYVVGP